MEIQVRGGQGSIGQYLYTTLLPKNNYSDIALTVQFKFSSYEQLDCEVKSLDTKSQEYKMLETFFNNTKGYQSTLKVMGAYSLARESEKKEFNPKKLNNKWLLWHGTRFSNIAGILKQGLRIQPPEAPLTDAGWFGKGIYLASIAECSLGYCHSYLSKGESFLLLCEAARGTSHTVYSQTWSSNIPAGTHSTHGVGARTHDPSKNIVIEKDLTVPTGSCIKNADPKATIAHDEYVFYDPTQVKLRYLLRVKG